MLFNDVNMLCMQLVFTTLDQLTALVYTQSFISVSCFEKLHHERCIYYKFANIIHCFNISDLHDVEINPLVGMLTILAYNESVFQPYQFAETVICCI